MTCACDVFIATEAEADAYVRPRSPVFRFPGVRGRGVNEGRLAWLFWTLSDSPGDYAVSGEAVAELAPDEVELPARYEIPHHLVHALAGLCDAHLQGLASEWACDGPCENDRVEPGDLEDLLLGMRQLARHALVAQCGMFLWLGAAGADED